MLTEKIYYLGTSNDKFMLLVLRCKRKRCNYVNKETIQNMNMIRTGVKAEDEN